MLYRFGSILSGTIRRDPLRNLKLFLLCFGVSLLPYAAGETSGHTGRNGLKTIVAAGSSIDYTGALFGYYRIDPDPDPAPVPNARSNVALSVVDRFLATRKDRSDRILLGMGNNFSPEFGASIEGELFAAPEGAPCKLKANPPRPGHRNVAPEVLYKDENRLPPSAGCDNVGRFLMSAGYSAIVPGREDFLYSARWLRRMALLFQFASQNAVVPIPEINPSFDSRDKPLPSETIPVKSPDKKLFMLAANLRLNFAVDAPTLRPSEIKTSNLNKHVKQICPLLFAWDPLPSSTGGNKAVCSSDSGNEGNTVTNTMDWLRRLDATFDAKALDPLAKQADPIKAKNGDGNSDVAKAMDVQARVDPEFRNQLLTNQVKLLLAAIDFNTSRRCSDESQTLALKRVSMIQGELTEMENDGRSGKHISARAAQRRLKRNQGGSSLADNAIPKLMASVDSPAECQAYLDDMHTALEDLYQRIDSLPTELQTLSDSAVYLLGYEARQAALRLLLLDIAHEQENIGYTIIENATHRRTLVIGVIGQETMKAVSPANLEICSRHLSLDQVASTADLAPCNPDETYNHGDKSLLLSRLVGKVKVTDPVFTVSTVVRAAWLRNNEKPFDKIVVMAQMPQTEAQELAAHVRSELIRVCGRGTDRPYIDLILSEAQREHTTPALRERYRNGETIPVLTPRLAWYIQTNPRGETLSTLVEPISTAKLYSVENDDRVLVNELPPERGPEIPSDEIPAKKDNVTLTMANELKKQLDSLPNGRSSNELTILWDKCKGDSTCTSSVLMQFLLEQIHRSSNADVVLLERRDFYFGELLHGYDGYQVCEVWEKDHGPSSSGVPPLMDRVYCQLRVALDRVLWKGDFSERVMVDGKSLKQMITTAKLEASDEESLLARDTSQQWLMTFGIVTKPELNLTAAKMGPDTFSLPGLAFCDDKGPPGGDSPYCVNGRQIADDSSFWVSTSDDLANDTQLYKVLVAQNPGYHSVKKFLFFAGEIADELARHKQPEPIPELAKGKTATATAGMGLVERRQQMRSILQVDFSKLVVGFMIRNPDTSNTQLQSQFSGVSDSRATTPSAQEFDFEVASRMTFGRNDASVRRKFTEGIQSDSEYDRAVTGNITGNPETVTYALNSFTTGGFMQWHLNGGIADKWHVVLAPYQYQRQFAGNYLNFKYSAGVGQITVAAPSATGFSQRAGLRYELAGGKWFKPDRGSYAEAGPEYSNQNNQLSALLLPNGKLCPASDVAFSACVSANATVQSSTVIKPMTETLHTGGVYWDAHLQKALDRQKHFSVTVETKGDNFFLPGVTLPTQTRHAFTTTGAVNFAIVGNLALSPTFTTFFYRNQGASVASNALVTNTFSITAKWYFARDASVPGSRQFRFVGPASLDQTKTAKIK